ncbi:hypothetical protein AVEN_138181-1 [Araneus ventricosus]|uniref:Uncharacterized protein n=1 Tax=Araneus ventricosus TaxID=182803 RepID=A0A4Y2HSR1_ARAVE|nr:hypothetical protein AVEN_138181-1 [Araneus ventricosus]
MVWSGEHRAFVIEAYLKNGNSVITSQRLFPRHFDLVEGRRTSSALKRKPPYIPRSVRTSQQIEALRQAVLQSPQRSARRHATAMRISDRSVRRILHLDLKFYPYKMMVVQEIKDLDWANRRASSEAILQNVPCDVILLSGDEAHFHLSGCVNKQNFRYFALNNPIQIHERPLHSEQVTVWCAVADFWVIGPYFFLRRTAKQLQ